jgi:hypothetical protein
MDDPRDESDFDPPEDILEWLRCFRDSPEARERACPTPGERLFYSLWQLHLRYHIHEFDLHPRDWDVEDLARTIGVWHELEFVQDDALGEAYHFPSQVVHVDAEARFPWRLLSVMEWAAEQEHHESGSEPTG